MNIFNINISLYNLKLIILGSIIIIFIIILLWLVCSYYIYKWFKMNIKKDYFYFNEYNTSCKNILKQYGHYPIKRIYLVRQPISKITKILLNIITLYKFEKEMNNYIETTKNTLFFPSHTSIIVEIKLANQITKKILIEKNNRIKLATNFSISESQEMRRINIVKNKYTINQLLSETRTRIGDNIFFNWSIYSNNCQIFTEELLKSLNQYNKKNIIFISQKNFLENMLSNQIKYPDFFFHIINNINYIHNILENIVLKFIYF